jgi:hypothetical protein
VGTLGRDLFQYLRGKRPGIGFSRPMLWVVMVVVGLVGIVILRFAVKLFIQHMFGTLE